MPDSSAFMLLHREDGVSISSVDAIVAESADWSGLIGSGLRHLVLNLNGRTILQKQGQEPCELQPGSAALVMLAEGETVYADRRGDDDRHRFAVISASLEWLIENLEESIAGLHPLLREEEAASSAIYQRPMSLTERVLSEGVVHPPVPRQLRAPWFRGKLLECFSVFGELADPAEGKYDPLRQRIEKATLWIRKHYQNDLDLEALASHVGCTPSYLSTLFKQHTGKTPSQKLREIRIERAAILLRDGKNNVTEAAYAVGYTSLSHFTKAFVIEKGVRPSDWRAGMLSS